MGKEICFECGNKSGHWKLRKDKRMYKGDGYCFSLDVETPYCEKCGSPIYNKTIEKKIRECANKMIREQTEIITKEEILKLVDLYGVSQKYLSKVLGWGEITLPRYIKGQYSPNVENSNKLKSIKNPYVLMDLLEKSDVDYDNLREKLLKNIYRQITKQEEKKGKLFKVVDWFLSNVSGEDGITQMTLQNALYLGQAWHYVFNGKWLFEDDCEACEAWTHGAVYGAVFDEFKSFQDSRLPRLNTVITLEKEEIETLLFIKENYLDVYSSKALNKICHKEEPFGQIRKILEEGEKSPRKISKNLIADYYNKIANEYSINKENKSNVRNYLNEILFD